MAMNCNEVLAMLPAYIDGDAGLSAVELHLDSCGSCRAELEAYAELLRALGQMRFSTAEPPPGLMERLMELPQRSGTAVLLKRHLASNRAAYLSGAAVAVTGAAGTAVWLLRRGRLAAA